MIQKKMITGLRLPPSLIRRLLVRLYSVPAVKPESKAETELINDILEGLSALSDGRCDALMLERDQTLSASGVRPQQVSSPRQKLKQSENEMPYERTRAMQAEERRSEGRQSEEDLLSSAAETDQTAAQLAVSETAYAKAHAGDTGKSTEKGAEAKGKRGTEWRPDHTDMDEYMGDSPGAETAETGAVITGTLSIYPRARLVYQGSVPVSLTAKEFDILYFLARNRGEVFTKEQIYQAVWDGGYLLDDSNIMAFVRKIRRKIEPNPDAPIYIQTVWGIGYKFAEPKPEV